MSGSLDQSSPAAAGPISFRQLMLLDAVARTGSVGRAAAVLGLTQPAATQALAVLARKAGVALLNGSTRGSTLTVAGCDLHGRAVALIAKLDRALRRLDVAERLKIIWRISDAQLRLLGATAEHGTLENAAIVLGVSLRAARRAMATTESLTGLVLFARRDGVSALTDAGRTLASHAGLLAAEMERAIIEVRESVERALQTIVIGAAPEPGIASLTELVEAQIAGHPHACIEIFEAGQSDLLARLAIGEVDLVLGHIMGDPGVGVQWEEIASARYRVVAGRGHPLYGRKDIGLEDLARYRWIFGAKGSRRRAASDALFAAAQRPACSLITSAPPLMARLLSSSEQLALMTDQELSRHEGLVPINVEVPASLVRLGLASRAGWERSSADAVFVDLIRTQLGCRASIEFAPAATPVVSRVERFPR